MRNESCLGYVLQELGKHVGLGLPLVNAALRSRVIRSRNLGLKVLQDWGRQNWPEDITDAVQRAKAVDPCDDVRNRMKHLLEGKPFEEA